jgi:hypothetical protein
MNKDSVKEEKKIVFFIGKVKCETVKTSLTVSMILIDYAKVNPNEKSLSLKEGNDHHEYTDINQVIEMKEGMHFILFDKTPTNVSCCTELNVL